MELTQLRALVTVAQSGSFTAAAQRLGYTQSAVSQQVRALEDEVGRALLERRPLRPTPAGARLIEHASRVLMRVDVARSELAALPTEPSSLRVATSPLAVPSMLAEALRRARRHLPSVHLSLTTAAPGEAVAALANADIDVALVDGVTGPDNPLSLAEPGLFVATGLVEEGLVVALPVGHPLAARPFIDLPTLTDAPWVATRYLPEGVAAAQRLEVAGAGDPALLLDLVAAGHGTVLLPASHRLVHPEVRLVPLRRPALVHRSEVLTRRQVSPAVATLVDNLRHLAREARRTGTPGGSERGPRRR